MSHQNNVLNYNDDEINIPRFDLNLLSTISRESNFSNCSSIIMPGYLYLCCRMVCFVL